MSFDLSKLPLPDAISKVSYDDNLSALLKQFKTLTPDWDVYLASDPVVKIFESCAYLLTLKDQQRNDQIQAVLISSSSGDDLDNLGALFSVARAKDEKDDRYRQRILGALSLLSSAGIAKAYETLALQADSDVEYAVAYDDDKQPAKAFITIQSLSSKDGSASADLVKKVNDYLNSPDRKPLGADVIVSGVDVIDYQIKAEIKIENDADETIVKKTISNNLLSLTNQKKRIGAEIALSEIYASMNIEGVAVVTSLSSPTQNIYTSNQELPYCTSIIF
ncbi:baseplate J/gp47 family protein [Francisella sp. SYW-9]|uniref:baseplate J/gp47 family protein n=1 Tax=Francisella sp. SYW-9 TaxID=2610888 RepID=UPI00123DA594|nr:baseplate J/gp47 family protein [Francisella sp. SYW-9]